MLAITFLLALLSTHVVAGTLGVRHPLNAAEHATLGAHNKHRRYHEAPTLKWDSHLAGIAENWANNCKVPLQHSGTGPENAFAISFRPPNGAGATNGWYDEIKHYNFQNPGYSDKTGHFTQVVWKSARRVGCGWSNRKCSDGMYHYFCRYDKGNLLPASNFRANVLRHRAHHRTRSIIETQTISMDNTTTIADVMTTDDNLDVSTKGVDTSTTDDAPALAATDADPTVLKELV